jgi:hypothetical protein
VTSLRRSILASIVRWIPLAALALLVAGMVYLVVQQNLRGAANDPQIQMATDARNALAGGATPESLMPANKIDIATSLAPYLAVYDANGRLLASSATLHGQPLDVPSGVFAAAKAQGINARSWMPEAGVRSAIVVVPAGDGYALAGRSLKLTEEREDQLLLQVSLACLATLGLTYLLTLATQLVATRPEPV